MITSTVPVFRLSLNFALNLSCPYDLFQLLRSKTLLYRNAYTPCYTVQFFQQLVSQGIAKEVAEKSRSVTGGVSKFFLLRTALYEVELRFTFQIVLQQSATLIFTSDYPCPMRCEISSGKNCTI